MRVRPKGNHSQNELVVDGQAFELVNAYAYDIVSAVMSVYLYNDNVDEQGRAVGKWWIAIATTDATITQSP